MASRDWSPAELSRKTNLSKATISRYLNDLRRPSCDDLYILSKMLGVSMNWLMGDNSDQESVAVWQQRACAAESKVSNIQKALQSLSSVVGTMTDIIAK